jgi:iron complex outermembrane receptor protein
MPADRFEGQLEYLFVDGKKLKQSSVQVGLQHVTKQTRVPPTGNIKITSATGVVSMASDYMAPPPAYSLINFDANTSVVVNKRMVGLILSVNNLLNTSYRDYMNSFRYFCLDRGRNISLKAKISL